MTTSVNSPLKDDEYQLPLDIICEGVSSYFILKKNMVSLIVVFRVISLCLESKHHSVFPLPFRSTILSQLTPLT